MHTHNLLYTRITQNDFFLFYFFYGTVLIIMVKLHKSKVAENQHSQTITCCLFLLQYYNIKWVGITMQLKTEQKNTTSLKVCLGFNQAMLCQHLWNTDN